MTDLGVKEVTLIGATLQDRLVKELRLRAISSIDAANSFAPEFAADFAVPFSRSARGFSKERSGLVRVLL
jgi:hypothetical protein